MDTIRIENKQNVKMIAHRGVSGLEKENSAAAFVAAGNRSYFGIETDVHITADHGHILIHDDTTGRVALKDINVEKSRYATLRKLRLTDTDGQSIRSDLVLPSLSEYINICKKYGKKAILELKNPMAREDICSICQEIEALGYLDGVIFISFDFDNLVVIRELYPEQPVQYLIDTMSEGLPEKLAAQKMDLDAYYKLMDRDTIARFHALGVKVNVWTVNTLEDAEQLIADGVDFITTNILE